MVGNAWLNNIVRTATVHDDGDGKPIDGPHKRRVAGGEAAGKSSKGELEMFRTRGGVIRQKDDGKKRWRSELRGLKFTWNSSRLRGIK
ncbi:UNVERIFIED_CONTAM: hypothetical protein Slati_2172200 [Sesamum latifolium]|uniref:Uncharacterized protein n=1 Tax=Sesamum latifolium TaxID=2727402 RepID=A0AAW2WWM3_9LAMI